MKITTQQMKELLIETFDLEMSPDEIDDDMAIVGDGLDLDSVDVLEIVTVVERRFKIKIKNEEMKKSHFASVGALTAFLNSYAS